MIRVRGVEMSWGSLGPAADFKIESILKSWAGTRYCPHQSQKQIGVNCVRFVAKVLDEFFGLDFCGQLPHKNGDISLHAPGESAAVMRAMMELYAPCKFFDPSKEQVLPADTLITGPEGGGEGHAMVAGARPGVLWHASPNGVVRTGCGYSGQPLKAIRLLRTPACLQASARSQSSP